MRGAVQVKQGAVAVSVLTVTTASDTVANDGVLSLREAIAAASGAVTIRFDAATFLDASGFPIPIHLESALEFAGGAALTIDGSLERPGHIYSVTIRPGAGDRVMTVQDGAQVTLNDLFLSGGTAANPVAGADGADGAAGAHGATGAASQPGTDATAGAPGSSGGLAVGGIVNHGDLILERVVLQSLGAIGGAGGDGGRGGRGGAGGSTATAQQASIGGDGGNGGNGGDAGSGGIAVGGIFNTGSLTLRDVHFSNLLARGGNGGFGDQGGNGGHGGFWGGGASKV